MNGLVRYLESRKAPVKRQVLVGPLLQVDLVMSQEKRCELWHALNRFITEHGGCVVSAPFSSPIRIEAPRDSTLPKRLAKAGYDFVFRGQLTRIGSADPKHDRQSRTRPLTACYYGFHRVDVYELALQ